MKTPQARQRSTVLGVSLYSLDEVARRVYASILGASQYYAYPLRTLIF